MFVLCYHKEQKKYIVCLKRTAQLNPERFQILETFSRYKQAEQALINKRQGKQEQLTEIINELSEQSPKI